MFSFSSDFWSWCDGWLYFAANPCSTSPRACIVIYVHQFCMPSRANENVSPQKRIENLFMIDDNVIQAVKFYLKMSFLIMCNSHTRFWNLSIPTDNLLACFVPLFFFWSLLITDPYKFSPIFLKRFLIILRFWCHKHWNIIFVLMTATIWVL